MKTADFLDSRLILLVLATKTTLFLANELIFDTSAKKIGILRYIIPYPFP